jgi:hypothetical protein
MNAEKPEDPERPAPPPVYNNANLRPSDPGVTSNHDENPNPIILAAEAGNSKSETFNSGPANDHHVLYTRPQVNRLSI